jgi:hypothetical protein
VINEDPSLEETYVLVLYRAIGSDGTGSNPYTDTSARETRLFTYCTGRATTPTDSFAVLTTFASDFPVETQTDSGASGNQRDWAMIKGNQAADASEWYRTVRVHVAGLITTPMPVAVDLWSTSSTCSWFRQRPEWPSVSHDGRSVAPPLYKWLSYSSFLFRAASSYSNPYIRTPRERPPRFHTSITQSPIHVSLFIHDLSPLPSSAQSSPLPLTRTRTCSDPLRDLLPLLPPRVDPPHQVRADPRFPARRGRAAGYDGAGGYALGGGKGGAGEEGGGWQVVCGFEGRGGRDGNGVGDEGWTWQW